MTKYIKYFNKLYKNGQNEFYKELKRKLENNNKTFIITANPETFSYAKKMSKYLR